MAIFAKAWDFQVATVLRTTLQENIEMVRNSVGYLKKAGREVIFDAEHCFDGYRANHEYALTVLTAAAEAGADWLVLCDTNGGAAPGAVAHAVADVVARFGVPVGIHAHNDRGACGRQFACGDRRRRTPGSGHGQRLWRKARIGNANLCSLLPNLVLKEGMECAAGEHLAELTELSRTIEAMANVVPNPRLPYVGAAAFVRPQGRRACPCRGRRPAHL